MIFSSMLWKFWVSGARWEREKKLTVRSPPNNHNPFRLQSARAMNKKSLKHFMKNRCGTGILTKKAKGKLAGTRSQLYRKLWCSETAHFSQNDARYNEKQRENTESMKKALFRQTQKTARRAPYTSNTQTSYQTPLAVREQTRRYCLRCTRHFDRLVLRPIEASAPQNWGILSTTSCLKVPQSWAESVSIARSYDRGDFQGRYTTPKNRIFVSARSRLYRRIFRFSLHFRVEHAPISV